MMAARRATRCRCKATDQLNHGEWIAANAESKAENAPKY